jgi:hypothetical protein
VVGAPISSMSGCKCFQSRLWHCHCEATEPSWWCWCRHTALQHNETLLIMLKGDDAPPPPPWPGNMSAAEVSWHVHSPRAVWTMGVAGLCNL